MKQILLIAGFLLTTGCQPAFPEQDAKSPFVIEKSGGRIVMAYKQFESFLNSDRSWENYCKMVLNPYPEMRYLHAQQLSWGAIDSLKFPEDLKGYKISDFHHFFTQYDEASLDRLYDSVIQKAHNVMQPSGHKPVDLCLFLPYGSCFVNPDSDRTTIYISLYIDPADVQKIMTHEYAHCLHHERCPEEPLTLRRELVSEGLAVYLTTVIDTAFQLKNAIPFMPEENVAWCMAHESAIRDSIRAELENSGMDIFKRYISDGGFASPPAGFVQKTAYFTGYRIIETCVRRGLSLEEICALDSKGVLEMSGYFEPDE
ncbi:hypothetical protein JW948_08120 [bacterium]|nr:hypothetical protein [bacterium]